MGKQTAPIEKENFGVYIITEKDVPITYTYRKLHAVKFVNESPETRKWTQLMLKWPEGMNSFVTDLVNRKEYKDFTELEVFDLPEERE